MFTLTLGPGSPSRGLLWELGQVGGSPCEDEPLALGALIPRLHDAPPARAGAECGGVAKTTEPPQHSFIMPTKLRLLLKLVHLILSKTELNSIINAMALLLKLFNRLVLGLWFPGISRIRLWGSWGTGSLGLRAKIRWRVSINHS